ncbi:hypothetical protein DZC30_16440 [Comamonas testosteroni]|uniref:Uncharacterized protein n=1 Tax=Comamonas testosteroni TaxID=285 RepID=A0A373FH29_COMTE|nr:hypothetical protein [Comamonas testosteroni]RGE42699.1 hypothetical protein DZC30_16440 [Comamonas testosteroni]
MSKHLRNISEPSCPTPPTPLMRPALALSGAAVLATLVACGGGGSGDSNGAASPPPSPSTPPAAMQWSGTVAIDQSIKNTTVCADLNANGSCDSHEPVSAATGADGAFKLSYQPSDTASANTAKATPLLAVISASSVDAASPSDTATAKSYVLSAPGGKSAQINPLTTLVQRYMKSSDAALAAAETAVAKQLGISVAEIYDYQSLPLSSAAALPDNARTAAKVTAYALELGADPRTLVSSDAAEPSRALSTLYFSSTSDYWFFQRQSDGVLNSDGMVALNETREGKVAGTPISAAQLFTPSHSANSMQLTDKGWNRCDASVPRLLTRGNPNRVSTCNGGSLFYGFTLPAADISGKSMSSVLDAMSTGSAALNDDLAYAPSTNLPSSSTGSASFPSGSQLLTSVSVQLTFPLYINNTTTDAIGSFTSLNALIAARPASAVNLTTAAGTIGGLGPYDSAATRSLRSAFIDGSTLQLYRCEADAGTLNNPHDCVAIGTSGYAISAVGGVNVLSITNLPTPAGSGNPNVTTLRGYAEYNGGVYTYRQNKALNEEGKVPSYTQRLNGVAWDAMKIALGL